MWTSTLADVRKASVKCENEARRTSYAALSEDDEDEDEAEEASLEEMNDRNEARRSILGWFETGRALPSSSCVGAASATSCEGGEDKGDGSVVGRTNDGRVRG